MIDSTQYIGSPRPLKANGRLYMVYGSLRVYYSTQYMVILYPFRFRQMIDSTQYMGSPRPLKANDRLYIVYGSLRPLRVYYSTQYMTLHSVWFS